MQYKLSLPSRSFYAIENGDKRVEGRTLTKHTNINYSEMKPRDTIKFINEDSGAILIVKVLYNNHYASVRKMLKEEGVENVLSSEPKTIEHGIESYYSFIDYKKNIKKYGIYAIGIKPI